MLREVRSARLDELDKLADIKDAGARRSYAEFAGPGELENWLAHRATRDSLLARFNDPDGQLLVVEDDSGPIAIGFFTVKGDTAKLSELYCAADGTGAGSALMEARIEIAQAAGCASVTCYCFTENKRAQAFLARHGFQVVREVPATETFGGSALLLLERSL